MSYLMSTRLSRAQYVVAIVGATGSLGKEVVNVFLTAYRPFFPRVLALLRETSSPAAQALAAQGAELHKIDASNPGPSLVKALEGVDVLVSLVGRAPLEYKNAVFEAALKNGVKVYFPSEFGSDYRLNDFPGWDNFDWNIKREHVAKAREIAQGKVKIVATYTGLFLEIAIAPYFGFDTANHTYTSVGSPKQRIAMTSKADIGRALAELSLLALSPETASRVPDDVHIAGTHASVEDVRDIVQRVRDELGVEPRSKIVLKTEDLETVRAQVRELVLKDPTVPPMGHLKILIAEGKMDSSAENQNELVNPDQKIWKWKTVEDYIREVGGRPFS